MDPSDLESFITASRPHLTPWLKAEPIANPGKAYATWVGIFSTLVTSFSGQVSASLSVVERISASFSGPS
jgi:hypothetical protein